jgi:hypothetical protein
MERQVAEPVTRQIFEHGTSQTTVMLQQTVWPCTKIDWLLKKRFVLRSITPCSPLRVNFCSIFRVERYATKETSVKLGDKQRTNMVGFLFIICFVHVYLVS